MKPKGSEKIIFKQTNQKFMKTTFITSNPDLLIYKDEDVEIEVRGGIKTDRMESLRVTLKIISGQQIARNNFDLYNDNQVQHFARRCAGKLQLGITTILDILENLTEYLEGYILDQQQEEQNQTVQKYEQTDQEIKESKTFLMLPNLMQATDQNIEKTNLIL